ncbi:MAG: 2OG-Fe(II) oxygenase [Planctomycetes bacterium]|nr:2OG-Fe(II) oxygenase [Planctomycetota bacterium]MCB9911012.1 2OG-Fe(II) oxygenase [Planctomycetota bacterium]HPF13391.1 2OG-Fe(II) oxygenase [Planctomycetota bacterium]HRV81846.1 2OG-Fe(II) oxygenase [Planctomycetota bacterium]
MSKPALVVLDDFLDEEEWTELWTAFQYMELHPVARTAGAWKLEDGTPLGGQEIVTPMRDDPLVPDPENPWRYPSGTALDLVLSALLAESASYAELIGDDWRKVSARPYVYPARTGLSWHRDDSELYAGAYIYYAHPVWDAHWGGELLVAEEVADDLPIMAHRFETGSYSEALLERGMGRFVMPKPNRLVILAGAPHAVAPVSPAAGHNIRASVSGFFLR